jgi:hypothetical protein
MEPNVFDFIGSVTTLLVIYFSSSWVRNWIKRLNEYDPFLQQPKYSSSRRYSVFILFWFVSTVIYIIGKTTLGIVFNIDSWIMW